MAAKQGPQKNAPGDGSLQSVLDAIRKDFGAGSIMRLGDAPLAAVEVIPTGSVALDEALGIGGFPRGRVVEIYGPESSGKTSIALHAVAQAQQQGLTAAFIDAEHAFDPDWAETLGADTDSLLMSQPDNGEQALGVAEALCRSGLVAIIVIDSVAALVPRAELDGEMGDSHVGLQARLMSQALRKLTGTAATGKTCVVFINQLREKVGVLFGSPETTTGGKALKFYASVRLDVRRIGQLKDGTETVGNRTRARVVKNKLSRPFGVAEFDFLYSCGISAEGELVDAGTERGVVKKSGAWYTFEGAQLGQGKENARRALLEDPELRARVDAAVRAAPRPAAASARPPRASAGKMEMSGTPPWET